MVVGGIGIASIALLGALGFHGMRKFQKNVKLAEAKANLGQIARNAQRRFEDAADAGAGSTTADDLGAPAPAHARAPAPARRLCPSASAPVPADRNVLSGKKYTSTPAEWQRDAATDAGFACLKFDLTQPQHFQYVYEATPTGFVARAHADLDGDGVFSTFELKGHVEGDRLVIAPSITETAPEE